MQQIAKRMKELRKNLGVSQEKLEEWLGVSQYAINRYENAQFILLNWFISQICWFLWCIAGLDVVLNR